MASLAEPVAKVSWGKMVPGVVLVLASGRARRHPHGAGADAEPRLKAAVETVASAFGYHLVIAGLKRPAPRPRLRT